MKRTLLATLAALVLLAPVAARADNKPLRHLEFKVDVSYTGMSTTEGFNSSGSSLDTDGVDEVIVVDVMAIANDGGIVVRTQATARGQAPDQELTCAVYGDGRVACPSYPRVTAESDLLLSYLGRGWYDPTAIVNGTWSRQQDFGDITSTSTYKQLSADGVNPVKITEHTELVSKGNINRGSTSDIDITYDSALSVPLSIHETEHPKTFGNSGSFTRTDIKLTKDSFAKP